MNKGVDDIVERRIKKANKKKETIDLFNTNSNATQHQTVKNQYNEDEDDDFVINTQVIDARELANNQSKAIDLNNNKWEEREDVVQFTDNEPIKKKIGWGDNIKKTAEPVIVDEYFPS